MWLLGAPEFWYGFAACAVLVFLALLPSTLFPRRTVTVYTVPDRAPTSSQDPFYKPGSSRYISSNKNTALREHRSRLMEERREHGSNDQRSQSNRIRSARKRALWHPHPDDLQTWGS